MTVGMPVTRQLMSTLNGSMEFMPNLKYGFSHLTERPFQLFGHKKYPSIITSVLMVPGSIVLGTCFILSAFIDLIRDTALAALNLLGIGITLGESSRSALFKENLKYYKKQMGKGVEGIKVGAYFGARDVKLNAIEGFTQTGKFIANGYLSILDRTPLAKFFP